MGIGFKPRTSGLYIDAAQEPCEHMKRKKNEFSIVRWLCYHIFFFALYFVLESIFSSIFQQKKSHQTFKELDSYLSSLGSTWVQNQNI